MTANSVIGDTIYAKSDVVTFRKYPDGEFYKTFSKGQNIGIVYSYVMQGTEVWWQLQDSGGTYYVKHKEGMIGDRDLDYAKENGIEIDYYSAYSISDQILKYKDESRANEKNWFQKYGTILLFVSIFTVILGFISSIFKHKNRR
jgi:hypothetical protein